MALSNPRSIFGVHSFTPYDRNTREPFGTVETLSGSNFALNGEVVSLTGGSNRFPFSVQDGLITAELTLTPKEYPDFLFEVFLGKSPTQTTGETGGNVTTPVNVKGSLIDATTGVASVTVESGQESELKFGTYVLKAASATTVDVFAYSGVDFGRGTDEDFEDDTLKINSSPLTVSDSGGTTSISNFGLEITGGSGTVALTTGDTAFFEVRPINDKASVVTVGGGSDVFPEFGAYMVAEKQGSGQLFALDIFRVKAIGMPINMTAKEFSEAEITGQAFLDRSQGGVFKAFAIDEF